MLTPEDWTPTRTRLDRLVAAITTECERGERKQGWVPCRVLRRLVREAKP